MQKNNNPSTLFSTPFSGAYWKQAIADSKSIRMLTMAALLIALRLILKNFNIPISQGQNIYFGYIFNAIGAMIYGSHSALQVTCRCQ